MRSWHRHGMDLGRDSRQKCERNPTRKFKRRVKVKRKVRIKRKKNYETTSAISSGRRLSKLPPPPPPPAPRKRCREESGRFLHLPTPPPPPPPKAPRASGFRECICFHYPGLPPPPLPPQLRDVNMLKKGCVSPHSTHSKSKKSKTCLHSKRSIVKLKLWALLALVKDQTMFFWIAVWKSNAVIVVRCLPFSHSVVQQGIDIDQRKVCVLHFVLAKTQVRDRQPYLTAASAMESWEGSGSDTATPWQK